MDSRLKWFLFVVKILFRFFLLFLCQQAPQVWTLSCVSIPVLVLVLVAFMVFLQFDLLQPFWFATVLVTVSPQMLLQQQQHTWFIHDPILLQPFWFWLTTVLDPFLSMVLVLNGHFLSFSWLTLIVMVLWLSTTHTASIPPGCVPNGLSVSILYRNVFFWDVFWNIYILFERFFLERGLSFLSGWIMSILTRVYKIIYLDYVNFNKRV